MTAPKQLVLTQERLMEILHYDRDTGIFTIVKSIGARKKGESPRYVNSYGYMKFCLDGRGYLLHRLAWLYVYGSFPLGELDHINTDKLDNRISNLREADRTINNQNHSKPRVDNKSGFAGVSAYNKSGKWKAQIKSGKKSIFLGVFDTKELAHACYINAKKNMHIGYAAIMQSKEVDG